MNKLCSAVCAALLVIPAVAMADDMGCDSVNYSAEVMAAFPRIKEGCQAVTMKDGKAYVKLKAEVVAKDKDKNTITLRMMDRNNKPISEVVLAPGPEDMADIQGKKTSYKDVKKGQDLDIYLEHSRWGLYASPANSNMVKIVSRKDL